jgi:phage replication-related protein YjqB (UPF0714/DUF867 family)
MRDSYRDIPQLMLVEATHVAIRYDLSQRSDIAVIAPHAGLIEPLTGELAEAIAASDHLFYRFSGRAHQNNRRLHVTSTHFSEPVLTRVLLGASVALTVHGCRQPMAPVTHLGGNNVRLRNRLERSLLHAGFQVDRAQPPLAGRHPHNLVNRTMQGGVQLEISRVQRRELGDAYRRSVGHETGCSCRFCRYVAAVRSALEAYSCAAREHLYRSA